jgi:hypothetical protein
MKAPPADWASTGSARSTAGSSVPARNASQVVCGDVHHYQGAALPRPILRSRVQEHLGPVGVKFAQAKDVPAGT